MDQTNRNIIAAFILIIIVVIGYVSISKIYKNHIDNEYLVIEKKIIESARECLLDNKCTSNKIKLSELIEKGYITSQIDPKSKEFISNDTLIECVNYECTTKLR